uniref:Major facilitator superfamily domain-containing protein 10 n=1 Tax=Equus caballus TaxID=9796 RepID=A0A5F5PS42_HORSE
MAADPPHPACGPCARGPGPQDPPGRCCWTPARARPGASRPGGRGPQPLWIRSNSAGAPPPRIASRRRRSSQGPRGSARGRREIRRRDRPRPTAGPRPSWPEKEALAVRPLPGRGEGEAGRDRRTRPALNPAARVAVSSVSVRPSVRLSVPSARPRQVQGGARGPGRGCSRIQGARCVPAPEASRARAGVLFSSAQGLLHPPGAAQTCHPSARQDQSGPIMGWGSGGSCTPRPPIRQQPASEPRVVTVIFLGLLLDLLAFTLLLPLLPGLLESHSRAHDPLYGSWQRGVDWFAAAIGMPAEKRYNSVLFGGLIGSVFSFLQFVSAPLAGAVSDCLGRRPVMLLSLAGLAASYAVWAASKSFAAFLASRVIGGISKGNVSLSTAIVADLGSPPAHNRGMAVIGVAFSLGFTLGPMLGASLPLEMAPWLALLFAVSDLLFIFCFLPETLPPEKRASSITLGFQAAADLLNPLALLHFSAVAHGQDPPTADRLGSLRRLGLVYFLYLFLFSGLEYTLSFLAHQRFQFSSLQQGKMFFFIGLTMATIQGAYARRISPGREIAAVKRAILLLVPAFLLIGWGHTLPVLGLGLLLYSFGSPRQKGTVMGTLRSLGALARAAGPMVAASVYWLAGARVCYTVCSGLFLLPFLLLRNLRPPAQTVKAE